MALGLKPVEIIKKKTYPLLVIHPNWERVFLKDLADVQNGFAFRSELFTKNKGIPLIRIRDISNNETENYYDGEYDSSFIVNKGDILIGMDGDFNVSIWGGKPSLLNQRVCRIKINSKNYSDKFLFICLQPYLNAINVETSSVTVKHLSSLTVKEIPLPLPPLPEQNKIVAKIEELFSELDNGVQSLKKAREQLKTYRQAVLKYAFEGKLTQEWREQRIQAGNPPEPAEKLLARIKKERETQYQKQMEAWQEACEQAKKEGSKKPAKPKKPKDLPSLTEKELAELPELPEGWGWEKLANVTDRIQIGPFGSQLHKSDYTENGIPIINPKHIKDQKISPHENISKHKANSLPQYKLSKNDILLGRRGEMGRSAPILQKQNGWFCGTGSLFIRFGINFLSELYSLILCERRVVNYLENKSRGTTMTNLNSTILNNLPVQIISYSEQQKINQEIETRLSVCDQLEQTIEDSLKKAEGLRQSILKKAFEGELTREWREAHPELVSGENSAERLLAGIQAEKEKNSPQRRRGR